VFETSVSAKLKAVMASRRKKERDFMGRIAGRWGAGIQRRQPRREQRPGLHGHDAESA